MLMNNQIFTYFVPLSVSVCEKVRLSEDLTIRFYLDQNNNTVFIITRNDDVEIPIVNRENPKSSPEVNETLPDKDEYFQIFEVKNRTELQKEITRRRKGLQTRILGLIFHSFTMHCNV